MTVSSKLQMINKCILVCWWIAVLNHVLLEISYYFHTCMCYHKLTSNFFWKPKPFRVHRHELHLATTATFSCATCTLLFVAKPRYYSAYIVYAAAHTLCSSCSTCAYILYSSANSSTLPNDKVLQSYTPLPVTEIKYYRGTIQHQLQR